MIGQKKCDCLIEVTTWAGLTVYTNVQQWKGKLKGVTQSQSTRNQPYQEIVVWFPVSPTRSKRVVRVMLRFNILFVLTLPPGVRVQKGRWSSFHLNGGDVCVHDTTVVANIYVYMLAYLMNYITILFTISSENSFPWY